MAKKSVIRQQRYKELRSFGVDVKTANKVKDKGNAEYIKFLKEHTRGKLKEVREIVKRVSIESGMTKQQANQIKMMGKTRAVESIKQGSVVPVLVTEIQFQPWEDAHKKYYSRFTVVVSYTLKNKFHKEVLERFVTITSMEKPTAEEVIKTSKKYVKDGMTAKDEHYPSENDYKVNWKSFKIIEAYEMR